MFMVSWRNVPPELGALDVGRLPREGRARGVRRRAARSPAAARVNALGFCVGGTLLACALAVLAARGDTSRRERDVPDHDARLRRPGRDRRLHVARGARGARAGARARAARCRAASSPAAFASLRANDLVWNYVVNNYLKGRDAAGVRPALLERRLDEPAGPDVRVLPARDVPRQPAARAGRADDAAASRSTSARIAVPDVRARDRATTTSCRGARRIATTRAASAATATFVLGASGHIAGVVNPPMTRRSATTGSNALLADDPDAWLARAHEVPRQLVAALGPWLRAHAGARRKAPRTRQRRLPGARRRTGPLRAREGR